MKRSFFRLLLGGAAGAFLLLLSPPAEAQMRPIPDTVRQAFSRAGIPLLRSRVPIEDFSLPLLGGGSRALGGLKGKVVFLNFWATWCPPCREEMPSMETLYRRLGAAGLEFLAVDIQEKPKPVDAFIREGGMSFPVALDESGRVSGMYGIRSIPTTFIVDRDGSIIAAVVGGRKWDGPEVIAAFETLLNEARLNEARLNNGR
ncbi:MAG: TlpA family protein disulfide reductase [Treponema sp.]|jgi:thiol-disulfide isomerase/thioredoxin|nr:TlpA family protein disulfide reductase [Treponema sp.]